MEMIPLNVAIFFWPLHPALAGKKPLSHVLPVTMLPMCQGFNTLGGRYPTLSAVGEHQV